MKGAIRFINTFEPGAPVYRHVIPLLARETDRIEVLLSEREYREARASLDELAPDRVSIRRISQGPVPKVLKRNKLWTHLSYAVGVVWRTLFQRGRWANVFLTQPPLFQVWGWALKVLRRQPYAVVVMDLYPDVAIASGIVRERGMIPAVMSWVSRQALKHADHLVVIGRCMKERVADQVDPLGQVHVIMNWADDESVYPVARDDNGLHEALGLEDQFVVLYSGNAGVSHTFDALLDVIAEFDRRPEEVTFIFVGGGVRKPAIEEACREAGVDNVGFLPFQSDDRLAETLSLGDVHFVCLRPGFEGLVVPSKTYGAWAAGRPVVYEGDRYGEIARAIEEHDIGRVVPVGDRKALREAIEHYLEDPGDRHRAGQRGRELSETEYGRRENVAKYVSVLRQLARSTRYR